MHIKTIFIILGLGLSLNSQVAAMQGNSTASEILKKILATTQDLNVIKEINHALATIIQNQLDNQHQGCQENSSTSEENYNRELDQQT